MGWIFEGIKVGTAVEQGYAKDVTDPGSRVDIITLIGYSLPKTRDDRPVCPPVTSWGPCEMGNIRRITYGHNNRL